MQTITLKIKDDYADKFMMLLDILPKGKICIKDEMDVYKKSKRFQKDKKMYQDRLADVLNGKAKLTEIDSAFWDEMDEHIKNS